MSTYITDTFSDVNSTTSSISSASDSITARKNSNMKRSSIISRLFTKITKHKNSKTLSRNNSQSSSSIQDSGISDNASSDIRQFESFFVSTLDKVDFFNTDFRNDLDISMDSITDTNDYILGINYNTDSKFSSISDSTFEQFFDDLCFLCILNGPIVSAAVKYLFNVANNMVSILKSFYVPYTKGEIDLEKNSDRMNSAFISRIRMHIPNDMNRAANISTDIFSLNITLEDRKTMIDNFLSTLTNSITSRYISSIFSEIKERDLSSDIQFLRTFMLSPISDRLVFNIFDSIKLGFRSASSSIDDNGTSNLLCFMAYSKLNIFNFLLCNIYNMHSNGVLSKSRITFNFADSSNFQRCSSVISLSSPSLLTATSSELKDECEIVEYILPLNVQHVRTTTGIQEYDESRYLELSKPLDIRRTPIKEQHNNAVQRVFNGVFEMFRRSVIFLVVNPIAFMFDYDLV